MGSIVQGLDLLALGSAAFTTGSAVVDGATNALAQFVGVIADFVDGLGDAIGS